MSSGKVKCTCGWSWNKSDSSKKDMYICHECGRDNSNNMKNGGWLDNYNDSQASAPEGFEGEGYSMKGRDYSPAWGGQFQMGGDVYPVNYVPQAQMGGTIAGAPGFSYARTQSPAPSNGKYAKKTMASAQNGKEMQYYQQGLDFKPKSISQNGGWLDNYDVAQNGKQVEYGTPEYREAYNKGEVVTDQGVRSPIQLDEVVVSKKSPAPGFWKQSRDKYLEEHQDDDVLGAIGSVATYPLGLAQQAMMYGLTGKVQTPTEGMGIRKGMEGFPGAVLNAVVDPANLFGAGEISGLNKLAKQSLVKSNPIISTIPKALKYGLYKELGNAALHTAADNVAKATYKLPIVDKLYKDLAYKVGNQSSGWDRSIDDLKDIFSKNYEGGDNFTGYLGDDKQKRDLLKQYIYGNQPGFEQSSVPIRGLDKYVKKYGEMENFKLSTSKLAPSDVTNLFCISFVSFFK